MLWLALLFTVLAQAQCLDARLVEELRREITFAPDHFDLCLENSDAYRLASSLLFLKTHPLPAVATPLSGNFLPVNGWGYLRARIKSFVIEPFCPQGQMAFVRATEPGIAHLCPSFFDPAFTIVERLPTLLHEAHHFDGDNFPHVHCTQGRLQGMRNACDPSLGYGGGYALETEALVRLAAIPGLSPELRARARGMALARAVENFNAPVTPYRLETIYLESAAGRAFLLDPVSFRLVPVRAIDRQYQSLVSRGMNLTVFPLDGRDAYAVDALSPALRPLPAEGEVARDYNRLPPAERPRYISILNDDHFSGSVTEHRFSVARAPNTYETQIDLPFSATAAYTAGELGRDDPDSLYLADNHSLLHRVQLHGGRTYTLFPPEAFPSGFRAFALFQGQRLALREDGALLRFEAGEWMPLASISERFIFLSRPFYWAPFLFVGE